MNILFILLMAMSLLGGSQSAMTPAAESTGNAAQSPNSSVSPVDQPYKPIKISGKGDKITTVKLEFGGATRFHFKHSGSHNFVVKIIDKDSGNNELLINTIGKYDGVRGLAMPILTKDIIVEVQADGKWSGQIDTASFFDIDSGDKFKVVEGIVSTGRGDALIGPLEIKSDYTTLVARHFGNHNFIVKAISADGDMDFGAIINEIGHYDGQKLLENMGGKSVYLDIQADGLWSFSYSEQ